MTGNGEIPQPPNGDLRPVSIVIGADDDSHSRSHESIALLPQPAAVIRPPVQKISARFQLSVEPDAPLPMMRDESHRELFSWGAQKEAGGNHNLALFEEPSMPFFSNYLKAHITPGPLERAQSSHGHGAKADLGVILGVYLPTIQHILGVTMFIRLFWLVGIAGLGQTFLLLFVCCLCV
ncbi:unnamed protein product, partial [Caenorhabditis auriculariae]